MDSQSLSNEANGSKTPSSSNLNAAAAPGGLMPLFKRANVIKAKSNTSNSIFSSFSSLQKQDNSSTKPHRPTPPSARVPKHSPGHIPISSSTESSETNTQPQISVSEGEAIGLEPPRKRRKLQEEIQIQAELDHIPLDYSIKDAVSFRTTEPLPAQFDIPPYYVYPADTLPPKFLDLCLASCSKPPHARPSSEAAVASFWEARCANWTRAFRSLQQKFVHSKQPQDFYLVLNHACSVLFLRSGAQNDSMRIIISNSNNSLRENLYNAGIDFSMPFYEARVFPTSISATAALPQEKGLNSILLSRDRESEEALRIDNQRESMIFVDTSDIDNINKFCSEMESLVLKAANPSAQQLLSLEDLPQLMTTFAPFSLSSMAYNHVSNVKAKDVDASGIVIETNQLLIAKPVLPSIWRHALQSLCTKHSIKSLHVKFSTDSRTLLNVRTHHDGAEREIALLSKMDVSSSSTDNGNSHRYTSFMIRAPTAM